MANEIKPARPGLVDGKIYDDFYIAVRKVFPRDRQAVRRETEKAFVNHTKVLNSKIKNSQSE